MVFDVDLSVKHPLHNEWSLWFYENQKGKSWTYNQKEVINFKFAEEFWSVYNNIKLATELPIGCDYAVFKEDIRPMWEDKENEGGGRWLIIFDKKMRDKELDKYWLDLLLLLIGENFGKHNKQICGAVLNIRAKMDKISLWIKNAKNKEAVHEIGLKIKECMGSAINVQLFFESHKETMVRLRHLRETSP